MEKSTQSQSCTPSTAAADAPKPSFFGRLLHKVDAVMKQKADAQAAQGCCCKDADKKSDKCC